MSGSLYNPDQTAVDTRWIEPWSEAFRAQRDVGLRVPINYVTISAASLTATCFSNNQYENEAFQRCFSNLLAVGFRKITVDVYWDAGRSIWSLCPVELPPGEDEPDQAISIASGPTVSLSSLASNAEVPTATPLQLEKDRKVKARQDDPQSSRTPSETTSVKESSTASPTPTSTSPPASSPSVISFPLGDGRPPLIQVGNYNCTSIMTLNHLTGILEAFIDTTSTTTEALITYLTLNVHAAASIADPKAPAQQPSSGQLPSPGIMISDIMRGNLSSEIFTPAKLRTDRANLNSSWNDVSWNNRPERGYYTASPDSQDRLVTEDGWPTEAYIEFLKLNRLVVGFGSIDPQMSEYNISADLDTIFPSETLRSYRNTTFDSSGDITSGCLFSASEDTITELTNSSWAVSIPSNLNVGAMPDLDNPITQITNLTSCGISSWLNTSLANATADQNPLPYAAFVHSTLWTWAPGQPLNATSRKSGSTANRCAGIYVSPNPGRWQVVDCAARYHVACQDLANPYRWELSASPTNYLSAASACPEHLSFSVPHTALENAHLLSAMMNHPSHRDKPDDPIFVDLNSLEIPDCWVQGANGTCPYLPQTDMDRTRVVVVPTIAAVIIFVCAALTFFVKCAANRREDKRGRRRRMVGGWEYEGVPS